MEDNTIEEKVKDKAEDRALIELKDVCKSYKQGRLFGKLQKKEVLQNINLRVKPHKCTGLLGESGSGKSTTARIVLALEKPDSGEVLYKGQDIHKLSKEERRVFRRNAQVVFQTSALAVNPRFRAWEIISEPLSYFEKCGRDELRSRSLLLLSQVGLNSECLDKLPSQFSGGELQRVCIARALALNPEFILLDEAVSALDMYTQSLIMELLQELQRSSGVSFLFISHDLRVLLKMCDLLAVMYNGRISSFYNDLSELEEGIAGDSVLANLASAVL